MKKITVSLLTLLLVVGFAGSLLAAELEGKVTQVKGKTVTIEITKGKAAKLDVGSSVKIEAEKEGKKAPKKGGDMLQGC